MAISTQIGGKKASTDIGGEKVSPSDIPTRETASVNLNKEVMSENPFAAQNELLNAEKFDKATPDGTIEAPNIESNGSFNIPDQPEPVIANKFISDTSIPSEAPEKPVTDPVVEEGVQSIQKQLSERQAILEELGLGDLKDTFEDLQGKGAFTQREEDKAGIDDKTIALNEIQSQIRETDLKFRRIREGIQTEAGLTKAQVNNRLAEVSRKQSSELADLSVIQATRRDDLATAQSLVDRKVELKFEPLEQKLQFQQFLFNENKDLFNTIEQRQFEAKMQKEQVQIDKDKFAFQQTEQLKLNFMMNAAESGKSNAYLQAIQGAETTEDLLAIPGIQSYAVPPKAAGSPSAPTVKEINGVSMQWDADAGVWKPIPTGSTPESAQGTKDSLSFLRNTIQEAKDLSGSAGPSLISRTSGDVFVGDSKFRQLEQFTNTLKTNVLTLMTDPSIRDFFGPQMSEADVRMMTSAGTTLDAQNNSPKKLKEELVRLDNLLNRMQTAVNEGSQQATGGNFITAPDGTLIEIID